MGIIYKIFYQCSGCGLETDNANDVRLFTNEVLNGNNTKSFIRENELYCLNCIKLALVLEGNEYPETVIDIEQKTDPLSEKNNNNISLRLDNLEKDLNEYKQESSEHFKLIAKNISKFVDIEKVTTNKLADIQESYKQLNKKIIELNNDYRQEHFQEIIEKQDEFLEEGGIEKFDDIKSLEPEITNQNDSDTEQEEILTALTGIDPNYLKDSGKYLVLCQIIAPEVEEYFAKEFCKLKNLSEMKDILGNISLKGVYFSINKYIDIEDLADFKSRNAKVVNKIIFGIPNIVDLEILCTDDFAIIDKEKFNIQFEPAPKYKITDENQSDIKLTTKTEKPQSTTVVKSQTFKDPIKDVIAKLPKKKISRLNISGDDYV
jgi:hypothetical protein